MSQNNTYLIKNIPLYYSLCLIFIFNINNIHIENMATRTYIIKENIKSNVYNCISCNKKMTIPLLECLHCSDKFNGEMRKKMESTDPFLMPPKKSKPINKDLKKEIICFFLQLIKDDIVSSRRESVFYINKKFKLDLMYWQIHKILSPENIKSQIN